MPVEDSVPTIVTFAHCDQKLNSTQTQ